MLQNIIISALFSYGMYTIQRPNFFLNPLTQIWKKYFPKSIHEPLYSCGICVASIWTTVYIVYRIVIDAYLDGRIYYIAMLPILSISAAGICALIDRAVKYFEYGYRYNPVKPNVTYSYLQQFDYRINMFNGFLQELGENIIIVEVGGFTKRIQELFGAKYYSIDKISGNEINDYSVNGNYFLVIQGLLFEGNMEHLITLIRKSKGFIIEGSMAGESKRQMQMILDEFPDVLQMPYTTARVDHNVIPEHCAGEINNRLILVKRYLYR